MTAPVLKMPDYSQPFYIWPDAPQLAMSGVLTQKEDDHLKDQVRKEVRLKDLNDDFTLDVMERFACQIDSILYSSNDFRPFGTPRQSGPTPMQGVHFGNLSVDEAAKYRQEGRCFRCHQTGKHTSGCKSRFVFRSHNMETGENVPQKEGESA